MNKISKPLFDSLVEQMDFKTFFKFGSSLCKHFRSLFFFSKRWRIVNLSFLDTKTEDKLIYKLCGILNQYYNNSNFIYIDKPIITKELIYKEDDEIIIEVEKVIKDVKLDEEESKQQQQTFHSFYIETLILDGLYKLSSNIFKYINNCISMSKIENLSMFNCLGIKFMNGFFEIKEPRNIKSLLLPSMSIEPSNYFKKLSSLTSISLPGTIESIQLYKYLESCPLLTKLELTDRSKDSLFNPSLLERLYKCTQITHLKLCNISIRNDIFVSLFMSLVNLEVINIHTNHQIRGSAINVALESIPNLKSLSINYCRNVELVNTPSTKLKLFHSSYTKTCPEIDFPNVEDLSITDWTITETNYFPIFSKFNNLRFLDLSKCKIDNKILDMILSLVGNSLESLDLEFNRIDNDAIDIILKHCIKLRKIYLNNTLITKEKANELYKIKTIYVIKT